MIVVIQRVKEAKCEVRGKVVSQIKKGILIFIGVEKGDTYEKVQKIAYKCGKLRIFEDLNGRTNFSIKEVNGEILVISQFTLCANCNKGLRPSFDNAEKGEDAKVLYKRFIEVLRSQGIKVKEGIFGEKMSISLVNEGPATFILSI